MAAPPRTLENFFRALGDLNSQENKTNDTISLANQQYWWNDPLIGSLVIKRSCYADLWNIIQPSWSRRNFLVIGTPGIGKTIFMYFVIWGICQQATITNTPVTIVVQIPGDEGKIRFLWDGATNTLTEGKMGEDTFVTELKDPNTYYLVDGCPPRSFASGRRAKTLEVSAPRLKHYQDFKKESGVSKRYLPILSFPELEKTWRLCCNRGVVQVGGVDVIVISLAKLRSNYSVVGGSCRLALIQPYCDQDYNVKKDVDEAIGRSQLDATLLACGEAGKENDVSDILQHYIVTDQDYTDAHYDFASPYVVQKLHQKHSDFVKARITALVESSKPGRTGVYFGTQAGRFFEDLAIRALCEGGTFNVRRIEDRTEGKIVIPPGGWPDRVEWLVEEKDDMPILPPGKIGVPVSPNFPCIDAFAVGGWIKDARKIIADDMFFQMKNVNSVEASNAKKVGLFLLTRQAGLTPNGKVRFYQVIPDFKFFDTASPPTPFKFMNPDGSQGAIPNNVEEWMLSIEIELTGKKRQKTS